MITQSQLLTLARQADEDVFSWASFVAQTEFLWQDTTLVPDACAWQALWFELEIVNALALAEWDEHGRPVDWADCWREGYKQQVQGLLAALLKLIS
ncbi:MAG: hypothetical protein ACLGJA_04505 [Gammaproteobacteria bacterium]